MTRGPSKNTANQLRARQELRRSNAAGPHSSKIDKGPSVDDYGLLRCPLCGHTELDHIVGLEAVQRYYCYGCKSIVS